MLQAQNHPALCVNGCFTQKKLTSANSQPWNSVRMCEYHAQIYIYGIWADEGKMPAFCPQNRAGACARVAETSQNNTIDLACHRLVVPT